MKRSSEAAMGHHPEEETAETEFYAFVDSLDTSTKATRRFQDVMDETEESGSYQAGIEHLKQFVKRRTAARYRIEVSRAQEHVEIRPEDVANLVQEIRRNINIEHFLGSGQTASVHTLKTPGASEGWVCAKIITNDVRYKEGRSVMEEMAFLDRLADLEVQGVRTPMPLFAFKSASMEGLVMEHLDAYAIERVMSGQTTESIEDRLPNDFDIDTFFDRIRVYIFNMHERGIAHGDLHPGNIMIDRGSGLPYIIDFGKARDLRMDESPITLNRGGKEWDRAMLRASEKELRDWMVKKGLTDSR